jgi:hypothetical protein
VAREEDLMLEDLSLDGACIGGFNNPQLETGGSNLFRVGGGELSGPKKKKKN